MTAGAEQLELDLTALNNRCSTVGYARVSTAGQAKDGTSLESQEEQLRAAGAVEIYKDVCTGATTDRPELNRLLNRLKPGDTLVVTKLDRIARSVSQGSELIQRLTGDNVTVNVLNIGKIDNSASGRLLLNVMLSFAEFERDLIIERTQEGRVASGNLGGRPKKFGREQIAHAVDLLQDHSYAQVSEMTGISKSTLLRARKEQV